MVEGNLPQSGRAPGVLSSGHRQHARVTALWIGTASDQPRSGHQHPGGWNCADIRCPVSACPKVRDLVIVEINVDDRAIGPKRAARVLHLALLAPRAALQGPREPLHTFVVDSLVGDLRASPLRPDNLQGPNMPARHQPLCSHPGCLRQLQEMWQPWRATQMNRADALLKFHGDRPYPLNVEAVKALPESSSAD